VAHDTRLIDVVTDDGVTLEAELAVPDDPWLCAVVCHPHPQHGGDMHAPVNAAIFAHLVESGAAALRFNFRGVGRSEGTFDHGRGERLDLTASIDHLIAATPEVPLLVAGWSFGAEIASTVDHPAIDGWFLVAAPMASVPADEVILGSSGRPKLLLVPEHDQFLSPESVAELVAGWPATTVEVVAGADHFLAGRQDDVCRLLDDFADTL